MKTMYMECNMGAAGDMLTAALLELFPEPQKQLERLNSLGIPGARYELSRAKSRGIAGSRVTVSVNGEVEGERGHGHHRHMSMSDIESIASGMFAPERVKEDTLAVYSLIAEAESAAHGCKVSEVHFHEVGAMDAVADVAGVCLLMRELAPERVVVSPIHVGCGTVRCAHGILPVPAPATAHILRGVPIFGGEIRGELCTPTGAALLKYFADEFGAMPVMTVDILGYGIGSREFEAANCIRVMLGRTEAGRDKVIELKCNLDDMTGEAIAFAAQRLTDAGALDVCTTAIGMKKSRPGIMLTCMCREADRDRMLGLIFKHTSTLGVREYICGRYTLNKTFETVDTAFGEIRVKRSRGRGVEKAKPEYDDMEAAALKHNAALSDIKVDI